MLENAAIFISSVLLSAAAGFIICFIIFFVTLSRAGLVGRTIDMNNLQTENYELVKQLQKNQEFLSTLPVKDHRAEKLVNSNHNVILSFKQRHGK